MPLNTAAFPILTTERLELVELQPDHAADLFRLFTDKRVTEYYTVFPFKTESDLLPVIGSFKTLFEARQGIRWGIELKGHDTLIGTIGFHNYTEGHKGTILFALMPEYQNMGYATEAIKAVIKFGFEIPGLKRIDGAVMPGNTASEQVLIKTGFRHEGLLRQWMQWNDQYYDMNMYAVLSTDIKTDRIA